MERDSYLYKARRKGQILAHKILTDEFMAKLYSRIILKKKIDLKNPQTFNEKIQWLKIHDYPNNPLVIKGADKYAVREYVTEKGLGDTLVPLLSNWEKTEDIEWNKLPQKFVLKCNHGCAYNLLCADKDTFNKVDAVKQLNKWMKEDFGAYNIELHYSKINPHIITCEEYLGECITDYKFYCFNGEPKYIYVSNDMIHDRQAQIGFFYMDGSKMPLKREDYTDIASVILPPFFDEMKKAAEILCSDFPFVRIDFFLANDRFYFAELTFTPSVGMMPLNLDKFDLEWGKMLDISELMKEYAENRKVAIIGHFGGKENILDGQTVKTKILFEELSKATDWNIKKVDTYYKSKNPVMLLWQTVVCLLSTRDIIVLLSSNGIKFYFPLLNAASKFFHTSVYHDVIGGILDNYVEEYPKFKNYLNAFRVNWVETDGMKKKLEVQGITNCEVIPNFKRLNCVRIDSLKNKYNEPYRFCTFSRVMKEKGIEDAIEAIQEINKKFGRIICELDIYGKIDEFYMERFNELLNSVTSAVKYCGMVPYDESVETIKDYYALLFPTYWDSEGFPGTIIDAFSAGLPVIATDWNFNGEIIENKIDGVLYPNDDINTLQEAIEWTINNTDALVEMKKNCVIKAEMYQPEEYIKKIILTIKQ
jgi:glycosyltransferase involved in cell wall biosynthesis